MSIGRSWYLGETIRKVRIKRCLCITIIPCPILKPKHLLNSRVWMCPQKLVFFLELEAFWGIRTTSIHFAQDQEANWTSSCRKLSLKSPLIRIIKGQPGNILTSGWLLFRERILFSFRAEPFMFFIITVKKMILLHMLTFLAKKRNFWLIF